MTPEEFVESWYNATRGITEVSAEDLEELTRRVAIILARATPDAGKTGDVVERVARALCRFQANLDAPHFKTITIDFYVDEHWQDYTGEACAALAAAPAQPSAPGTEATWQQARAISQAR